MMTQITIADVVRWRPCDAYRTAAGSPSRAKIRSGFGGRDAVTPREALDLDIPHDDRLWLVLREDVLPARVLREFACDCAERALTRERDAGREPDARSWASVAVARRHARGEATDEELDAARAAAWDAARAAAWAAAWAAARDAARAAAWDAAWDAARDAAWAAARDAAWDAEQTWQRARLAEILEALPGDLDGGETETER